VVVVELPLDELVLDELPVELVVVELLLLELVVDDELLLELPTQTPLMQVPPGHPVPSVTFACVGHELAEPVQSAACKQAVAVAHTVELDFHVRTGQVSVTPSQTASFWQGPVAASQTWAAITGPQVPSVDAPASLLHASQSLGSPLPHALSQQTPSTQNPLAQLEADVHAVPRPWSSSTKRARARTTPN
jgi:hypothetical protein